MPQLAQRRAEQFFDQYSDALSDGDLEAIARCYAYPSIVVTETASRTISSPQEVIDAFATTDSDDAASGLTRVVATVQSIDGPSSSVAWVTVRWSYRDDGGAEQRSDAYRYLVRAVESVVEICTVTPVPEEWAR